MTQALYAHMNKKISQQEKKFESQKLVITGSELIV
jgi:hypothetical protein